MIYSNKHLRGPPSLPSFLILILHKISTVSGKTSVQVSPAFYAWSKHLLLKYRYSSDAAHPITLDGNTMPTTSLAGISLYTPRIEEVTAQRARLDFNRAAGGYNSLLFQTPCRYQQYYCCRTY